MIKMANKPESTISSAEVSVASVSGELKELVLRLYEAGFNVVLTNRDKESLTPWSSTRRLSKKELKRVVDKAYGVAIVGGSESPFKGISDLLIVDVDKPSLIDSKPILSRLLNLTVRWLTGPRCPKCENKKLEVLEFGKRFKCESCGCEFNVEEAKRGLAALFFIDKGLIEHTRRYGKVVELMVNNYELIPPSIHPTGVRYEWVQPIDFESPNYGIYKLEDSEFRELIKELEGLRKSGEEVGAGEVGEERKVRRKLTEEQIRKLKDLIIRYYEPGHRDRLVFSLLGLLIKAGIDHESSKRLIELITTEANDEEAKQRLYLVDYHYGRRVNTVGVEKLLGVSGLREELESILRERGLSEDEIAKQVSETITELYSILGLTKIPHTAWLKRKGDLILEWVYAGKHGTYLFRRGSEDKPVTQVISNAVIKDVKEVKVLGLNLSNLYKVYVGDEVVTGTLDELVSYIEKHYGVERGYRYAVQRLIQYMAEEGEGVFYSPGPWVVDGRLVFAREPGYTPSWRPYITWDIPDDDIDVELKKKALEAIKKLVEAYRNPAKPSLVLSYAAISPLAHYIKRVLNIAFHMIIHGVEGTGKSVLTDTIKLIFNITDDQYHPLPRSDFQARVCLSLSTLPAIVDEIGGLIEGYKNGRKDAVEVVEVLQRAATQELLRVSGSHQYGGYFLAVRAMIATTNSDISLVPWQLDKFVVVRISSDDAIDVSKAVGYTPRTMDNDVKNAMKYVGVELLREVERLIPEIDGLRSLPRDELRVKLIELGYRAWVNLYKKYGLEPFPQPAVEVTSEKVSINEQYRDVFKSYLALVRENKLKDAVLTSYEEELVEVSKDALESLEKNHVIEIKYSDGRKEIVCKTTFLTKFNEYVSREYGLPRVGWENLAEILGLRRTRRKIGGKTINNLLHLILE
jgi:hypothetical protein